MIWNDKFMYGHIPRTAGDACAEYLTVFKNDLSLNIDNGGDHHKHDPFWMRDFAGKRTVMTIRRLPSWYLAFIVMVTRQGIGPENRCAVRPKIVDLLEPTDWVTVLLEKSVGVKGNFCHVGDMYLNHFTNNGKIPIDVWLRTENLKNDVVKFVKEYVSLTDNHVQLLNNIPNRTRNYNHEPFHHWTPTQIQKIYENNPLWASVEKKVYRNLLTWDEELPPPKPAPEFWHGDECCSGIPRMPCCTTPHIEDARVHGVIRAHVHE